MSAGVDLFAPTVVTSMPVQSFWPTAAQRCRGTMVIAIGISIAVLASRLLRGDLFGRVLSRTAFSTTAAIGVGGILWQLCSGIGGQLGSAQMFTVSGWQLNDRDLASNNLAGNNVSEIGWPFPADGFNVDLWPIGAALAIVAIGIAFRYGETLQADAERITRRNLQLRRDTDGLI